MGAKWCAKGVKMKILNTVAIMLLLHLFDITALANVQMTTTQDGFVKFKAIGRPQLIKILGESKPANGHLKIEKQKVSGSFELDLQNLKTGIDLRDTHLRDEYLHVKDYPKASLELVDLPIQTEQLLVQSQSGNFSADLTLHGVTKRIQGTYQLDPKGKQIAVSTKFSITLSDFNVKIPTYLGVTVSKDVEIETQSVLQ
jgi:hypothetical protein